MTQETHRRQQARATIELKVEYKRLNTFFQDYTKNISKGGTFIRTRKPLDVGTVFMFKLMVPSLSEPLALRGEVRWVVQDGDPAGAAEPSESGMGIRFIYDDDEQRAQVERRVEKLMVDSLGPLIYAELVTRESGGGDDGAPPID